MLRHHPPRLLIIPGLNDSPSGHWQSWLEQTYPLSLRVTQEDWQVADLDRWAGRIESTLRRARPGGPWLAVAHSFGVLALMRHLRLNPDSPVAAGLLVAPADPRKFGVQDALPDGCVDRPLTMVLSMNDPWLSLAEGLRLSRRWGTAWRSLGEAGHINVDSGFGPLPLACQWVTEQTQRVARQARHALADPTECLFAV